MDVLASDAPFDEISREQHSCSEPRDGSSDGLVQFDPPHEQIELRFKVQRIESAMPAECSMQDDERPVGTSKSCGEAPGWDTIRSPQSADWTTAGIEHLPGEAASTVPASSFCPDQQ